MHFSPFSTPSFSLPTPPTLQMALGEPPRCGVPAFRLLFLIVREPPPQLEGPFSTELKDFVWQCLRKAPADRPSAIDLLMHPFVVGAERPRDLTDTIAACVARREAALAVKKAESSKHQDVDSSAAGAGAAGQGWDFGTVRAAAPVSATVKQRPEKPMAPAATVSAPKSAPRVHAEPVHSFSGTVVSRPAPPAAAAPPPRLSPRLDIPTSPAAEPPLPSASASSRPLADAAPLKLLMQPALRGAAGNDPRAAAAAESAAAALAHLEVAAPGATRAALTQMLALLGASGSSSLSDLRAAAESSFGGAPPGARGAAPPPLAAAGLPSSNTALDLGPLGNFLLAQWQEDCARDRAVADNL